MPAISRSRSTTSTSRSTTASTRPGATNILPRCYDDPQFATDGAFCRLVTRAAGPPYNLTVSNAHTNIATQIAEGIDYTIRYQRDLGPGSFRVNALATHYLSQANKLFEDDPLDELNGSLNNPENTANLELSFTLQNWRFLWGVDWIDQMESYTVIRDDATPRRWPRRGVIGDS